MKLSALCLGLSLVAVAGVATAHPHVVRKLTLPLQSGQVEVNYFSLPFNAKHLEIVPEGMYWHLGFATMKVTGKVTASGQAIATGKYHLFAHAEKDRKWSLVLVPEGSGQTIAITSFQIMQETDEAKRKDLVKETEGLAQGKIVLPTRFEKGGATTEHLRMTLEDEGVNYGELGPAGKPGDKAIGRDFALHVDFGDLHGSVAFSEPMGDAAAKESGSK